MQVFKRGDIIPIYSYICKECGAKFDLLVGMTQEKTALKCIKCGSKRIEKRFGSFNVGISEGKDSFSGGSCSTGTCGL